MTFLEMFQATYTEVKKNFFDSLFYFRNHYILTLDSIECRLVSFLSLVLLIAYLARMIFLWYF